MHIAQYMWSQIHWIICTKFYMTVNRTNWRTERRRGIIWRISIIATSCSSLFFINFIIWNTILFKRGSFIWLKYGPSCSSTSVWTASNSSYKAFSQSHRSFNSVKFLLSFFKIPLKNVPNLVNFPLITPRLRTASLKIPLTAFP